MTNSKRQATHEKKGSTAATSPRAAAATTATLDNRRQGN